MFNERLSIALFAAAAGGLIPCCTAPASSLRRRSLFLAAIAKVGRGSAWVISIRGLIRDGVWAPVGKVGTLMGPVDPLGVSKGDVSSELSGSAKDVVQARDVSGGIHFHTDSTSAAVPHLLRADVTGFVGREAELAALAVAAEKRSGLRLVVVAGTAGAGKTSLALRFAHRVRPSFSGGDLFVDLRGYDPGPPVAPTTALALFLRALGVAAGDLPADLEGRAGLYRSLLAGRSVLVVLDNAATVGQVRPLLPGDGGALVVVTSRSRLSGLTARDGARRIGVGVLDQAAAVDLIQAVTDGERVGDDPEQVAELAALCARLPLALRIAAERAAARPFMPLPDLIAQLRSGSGLWEALSSDDDEQEADAVRTVFAWSYRALPPIAARAFRLLGLHPGPEFGARAAAALLGVSQVKARTMLDVLAGAHLLEQTGPARFQYHDLLRAFAADTAAADEPEHERREAFQRIADWYLHSARAAALFADNLSAGAAAEPPVPGVEPEDFTDYQGVADWYAAERHNLQAMIRALEQAGDGEAVFQLAMTVRPLIFTHGSADDRLPTAQAALRGAVAADDLGAQARAFRALASTERLGGDLPAALEYARSALDAFETLNDPAGAAEAANALALVLIAQRDLEQAQRVLTVGTERADADGQQRWAALLRTNSAGVLEAQGDFAAAVEVGERCVAGLAEAGYQGPMLLEAHSTVVRACIELQQWDQARQHLDAAERHASTGADPSVQATLLTDRAELLIALGHPAEAQEAAWQAENLARALGERGQQARILTAAGRALRLLGRAEEAAGLHRRAVQLRRVLPDRFKTAEALGRLAEALADIGEPSEASAVRGEAVGLLDGYRDRRATDLRARLADVEAPEA
ncbi:tetratricopeptide repeat protein [Catenulispora sp. NL8]|uniref:Tetratricopeptide repeat protein n=1 Tax=Catenulispora pinistramenti TaxID=2705254 RepID=A0ABS5KHB9_9ACTN|nr:tetratricopeptide repeat protein [Catenulispora pinistramenti]MBS2545618.1 tetratricopeptide repeat protein [Catenulispora pinistramenti]